MTFAQRTTSRLSTCPPEVQAAVAAIQRRLSSPSLHWGAEDLHPDALPHIAAAALDSLTPTTADLIISMGDCEFHGRCACGATLGTVRPDKDPLNTLGLAWERHVMTACPIGPYDPEADL